MKAQHTWKLFILLFLAFACTSPQKQKSGPRDPVQITIENHAESERIDISIDGDLFTSYRYADTFEKPFLFPVIAASGTHITRGYPVEPKEGESVDHPHHTGYWFNYGNVNGIDFWGNSKMIPAARKSNYGTIRLKSIDTIDTLPGKGIINLNQEWVNPDGSIPMEEQVTFVFSAGPDYRIIDRISTLTAKLPVVSFPDTKEGAFAIRVARFLEFPSERPQKFVDDYGNITDVPVLNNQGVNGNYLSSEGIEGKDVWGTRAKWMNLYGTEGLDTISVVFMDHPSNLNFPTYWHARTYGLFAANPFGAKDFTKGEEELNLILKAGETLTFRHRLFIQSGKSITVPEIEKKWKDFTEQE